MAYTPRLFREALNQEGTCNMASLLDAVLGAPGGLNRWQQFSKVAPDAVTTGGLFPLKGLMPDLSTRRMTV